MRTWNICQVPRSTCALLPSKIHISIFTLNHLITLVSVSLNVTRLCNDQYLWEERKVFGYRGQILKEEFAGKHVGNGKHRGDKVMYTRQASYVKFGNLDDDMKSAAAAVAAKLTTSTSSAQMLTYIVLKHALHNDTTINSQQLVLTHYPYSSIDREILLHRCSKKTTIALSSFLLSSKSCSNLLLYVLYTVYDVPWERLE
ncbi:hypothetical protein FXO38_35585 [Capsicum annuum]|nr:hypothetical protein FXO38_35585 [Capsicum annuum]